MANFPFLFHGKSNTYVFYEYGNWTFERYNKTDKIKIKNNLLSGVNKYDSYFHFKNIIIELEMIAQVLIKHGKQPTNDFV
jgi:hypothetical protein